MDQGFLDSELTEEERVHPLFHVIPVPLEATVSYGRGTARGPGAIIEASQQLERWDGRGEPVSKGITTLPEVDCSGRVAEVLERIEAATASVLDTGGLPVVLGGEHTVSLGPIRALSKHLNAPLGIIQIDAHADLRDSYEGSPYSHACVMRRAIEDCGCRLYQFGVRALSREEVDFRTSHQIHSVDGMSIPETDLTSLVLPEDFPDDIYLTIDVDGVDPAVIPATGTPVPGGPSWHQTVRFLETVLAGRRLRGFDCVELAPQKQDPRSDFAAAMLVYTVMGMVGNVTAS